MVVVCPGCSTRFALDDSLIPGESAKVRCSRCHHTFLVQRPAGPPAAPAPETSPASPPEVLSGPTPAAAPTGPEAPSGSGPDPVKPGPPRRGWRLWAAGMVLVGLAAGGALWLAGPRLLHLPFQARRLPAGTPGTIKPPPPPQIPAALSDLKLHLGEARFGSLENAHGGRLLVLTGEVENQGQTPRGPVKLTAALVDAQHREIARCLAFAGSTFTDQELTTKAPEEINRRLATIGGNRGVGILPPGQRQPFTLVFFGVPGDLATAGYGFTLAVAEAPAAPQP